MAQTTMYPAKANSPQTELSAGITDTSASISVVSAAALPDAPNLATIGTDENAETVIYTGKSGNTLTGVTRGVGGTTARAWGVGIKVARYFTAYDHDAFRSNIQDISTRITDANTQTTALGPGQNVITASEAGPVAVSVKGNTLVNLPGNVGNFEVDTDSNGGADGWWKLNTYGTLTLESTGAVYGTKAQRVTALADDAVATRGVTLADSARPKLLAGKYYLLLTHVTTDGGPTTNAAIRLDDGTTGNYAVVSNSSTATKTHCIKISPPSDITARVILYNYAPLGSTNWVQFDGARIVEVDAATYALVNVDPEFSGEKVATRYPYVDGVKHVTNPVITKIGKNLLPPFTQWTSINANFAITEPYKAVLTAPSTTNQITSIDIPVITGQTYVRSMTGTGRMIFHKGKGTGGTIITNTTFTVDESFGGYVCVRLDNAITAGTFTFENPQLELGTAATPYEPRNDDYLYVLTTLAGYGGVNDVLTVRGAEATVLRRWKADIVLDGSIAWLFHGGNTGNKIVKTDVPGAIGPRIGQKFDGKILTDGSGSTSNWSPDVNTISSNVYYLAVSSAETGWGDSFSPSTAEIKAWANGWRMNNGTFGTPYNGTGTKTWTRWDATSNTGAVTTVPTTMAEGYTPYKLSYQLAAPVTEVVPVEGSLANHAGINLYEVNEGVIVREKATPKLDTGRYYIITGDAAAYWGDSRTKRPASRMLRVYKNGIPDFGWTEALSVPINASIIANAYDPNAEYTITYLAKDKYALTAPVVEGALEYKNNMAGVLSEIVKQMADNNTRDTIQDGRLMLDEAYIRNFNLDLSGATASPTASTLMKRDSAGRAQVPNPSANGDITNKGYVDSAITTATPDGSLSVKGKVQLSNATNSTSEALAATPKAVKDAYDRGSAAQTKADAALPKDGSAPMTGPLTAPRLSLTEYGTPLEMGRYIDMHKPGSSGDYDARITVTDENQFRFEPAGGTGWELRNNGGVMEFFTGGAWKPVGGIKSVQRGTVALTSTPTAIDVTISAVDMGKAYVLMSSGAGNGADAVNVGAYLLNATTVRITRVVSEAAGSAHWQVVESY